MPAASECVDEGFAPVRLQRALQRQHQRLEIRCRSADPAVRDAQPDSLRETRPTSRSRFERLGSLSASAPAGHATSARRPLHDRIAAMSRRRSCVVAIPGEIATSRAGFCCRGTNFLSASAMTAPSADDSVGPRRYRFEREHRTVAQYAHLQALAVLRSRTSPDATRAGCRWPPMSSHNWPLRAVANGDGFENGADTPFR
jgi:hypothetical protein